MMFDSECFGFIKLGNSEDCITYCLDVDSLLTSLKLAWLIAQSYITMTSSWHVLLLILIKKLVLVQNIKVKIHIKTYSLG